MKTNFYRLLSIFAFFLFAYQCFAQNNLRFGAAPNNPVVTLPNAYWDILRSSAQGWERQYWWPATQSWENYEKTINTKNADGLFTEVSTLLWDATSSIWLNNYQNLYTYQKNSANQITEATWTKETPSYSGGVRFNNTYVQGRLSEMMVWFKNNGTYVATTKGFFKYDGSGNRILDSGINVQQNTVNLMSHYMYDNSNRCIKNVYISLNQSNVLDTLYFYTYAYDATGSITAFGYNYRLSNGAPFTENVVYNYTYNAANQVEEMTAFFKTSAATPIQPDTKYKHYYNNQNKLMTMVSLDYDSATNSWENADSMAVNYLPNGLHDTAFVYSGNGGKTWETEPYQRLLFGNTSTGINKPAATVGTLKAYPNPATETLFVEMDPTITDVVDVTLTDMAGKVIKTQQLNVFAGTAATTQLSLTGIANGIYTLRVGNTALKVVKQ